MGRGFFHPVENGDDRIHGKGREELLLSKHQHCHQQQRWQQRQHTHRTEQDRSRRIYCNMLKSLQISPTPLSFFHNFLWLSPGLTQIKQIGKVWLCIFQFGIVFSRLTCCPLTSSSLLWWLLSSLTSSSQATFYSSNFYQRLFCVLSKSLRGWLNNAHMMNAWC